MLTIALADDDCVIYEPLRKWLAGHEVDLIFNAQNGRSLLDHPDLVRVQLVLMDIRMPGMDGLEATKKLKKLHPDIKALCMSAACYPEVVSTAVSAGASGFISKTYDVHNLIQYIRMVMGGKLVLCQEALQALQKSVGNLTQREHEFLNHLCTGKSHKQIAHAMGIEKRTVDGYSEKLKQKLNLPTDVALAVYAVRNGWG